MNIFDSIITFSLLGLLFFFIIRTRAAGISSPYLIMALLFTFIHTFHITLFVGSVTNPVINSRLQILEAIYWFLSQFQIFFFLSSISQTKPKIIHVTILALLISGNMSILITRAVFFTPISDEMPLLYMKLFNVSWLLQATAGMYIGFYAFFITSKIMIQTKEWQSIYQTATFAGWLIFSIINFYANLYITIFGTWLQNLYSFGQLIMAISLFALLLGFIINPKYLYRMPYDYYILMVAKPSGTVVFSQQFQSRKEPELNEDLVSGFLSAVNDMFNQTLDSRYAIEEISNKDRIICIMPGKSVIVTIIGERVTGVLKRALKRFVILFEEKYIDVLESDRILPISHFDGTKELIPKCFPFFKEKSAEKEST
ncbi:MAG: hypothetical protein ACFFCS_04520 [Candidatus Hodarchaeota archaeon]